MPIAFSGLLVIRADKLIRRIPPGPQGIVPKLKWDEWGPQSSRWVTRSDSLHAVGLGHITGFIASRIARLTKNTNGDTQISVYDFNPPELLPDSSYPASTTASEPPHSASQTLVIESSVIPCGKVFRDDVVSSLPYSVTTRVGRYDSIQSFHMSDDICLGQQYVRYLRFLCSSLVHH
jgi:hypothetical protein